MDAKLITSAYETIGAVGTFLIVILIAVLFIFKKEIITKFQKSKTPIQQQDVSRPTISRLVHHRFFNVCDQVENTILSMSFITHGKHDVIKTKLMHHLIMLKCASMKDKFTILLNTNDIDEWDEMQLLHEFKNTLLSVVKEYNSDAKKSFIRWGVSEVDAKYLIDTYEEYRASMVEGFIDSLDSVLTNSSYTNNFDKVTTVMELCSLAIFVIPRDVKSSFEAVNGRFAKYTSLLI